MRCEEGGHVFRNPERSVCPARPSCDEREELGVRYADPGTQVGRDRVQQSGDNTGLSSKQPFEAVQSHVGRAETGILNPGSLIPCRDEST